MVFIAELYCILRLYVLLYSASLITPVSIVLDPYLSFMYIMEFTCSSVKLESLKNIFNISAALFDLAKCFSKSSFETLLNGMS